MKKRVPAEIKKDPPTQPIDLGLMELMAARIWINGHHPLKKKPTPKKTKMKDKR
jgi:hypothetical protein